MAQQVNLKSQPSKRMGYDGTVYCLLFNASSVGRCTKEDVSLEPMLYKCSVACYPKSLLQLASERGLPAATSFSKFLFQEAGTALVAYWKCLCTGSKGTSKTLRSCKGSNTPSLFPNPAVNCKPIVVRVKTI